MNEEDGGVYGGHRKADQEAPSGAAQQPNPGGPPHSATLAQHLAYFAQQRAIAQTFNSPSYVAAQQGTGLGGLYGSGQMSGLAQAFTAGYPVYGTSALGMAQGWVDPAPPPPIEDAGISAGEIIGHRVWRLLDNGWLQSMAMDTVWAPDEPMTLRPEHEQRCGSFEDYGGGVHAFKTQAEAIRNYSVREGRCVYGTVALWGKVIEHERGYRAEFGKILSVDHVTGVYRWRELRLLREIRQRYGLEKANAA